jgi:hypothetical protein
MKTNPSHYVLALEILAISLFHAVKIRSEEKHPADIVYNSAVKQLPLQKPVVDNTRTADYILLNLVK